MASRQIKKENKSPHMDFLKWMLVLVILLTGIYANYYFEQIKPVAWAIRVAVGIVVVIVMAFIAVQTVKGQSFWVFIKSSRAEIRKVTWSNRQEVTRTTLIVVVMVVITALVLWALDTFFLWVLAWLTGQRG